MQSPTKLKQALSDLLGPPGPDGDPLELMLRTVVATTAPTLESVLGQYTPEALDTGLEQVALYFLRARSDGAPFSPEFVQAVTELAVQAAAAAHPAVEGAEASPELPAGQPEQTPDPQPAAQPPAPQQPQAPTPAPAPAPAPGAPPAPPWGG